MLQGLFFSSCSKRGLVSGCNVRAPHCLASPAKEHGLRGTQASVAAEHGFNSCSSWTRVMAWQWWCMGLAAPWRVGSSRIRDWIHVSCIGRRILYHWSARRAFPLFLCKETLNNIEILVTLTLKPSNLSSSPWTLAEFSSQQKILQVASVLTGKKTWHDFFYLSDSSFSFTSKICWQWWCPITIFPFCNGHWTMNCCHWPPTKLFQRNNPSLMAELMLQRLKGISCFHSLCLVRNFLKGKAHSRGLLAGLVSPCIHRLKKCCHMGDGLYVLSAFWEEITEDLLK